MVMPPKRSLAQQGYEAYTAILFQPNDPLVRGWRELRQAERDAWAVAVDAILDGWEAMVDADWHVKE